MGGVVYIVGILHGLICGIYERVKKEELATISKYRNERGLQAGGEKTT